MQPLEVNHKVLFPFEVSVGNGLAPVKLDLGLVDREPGVRVKDLVSRVHEGHQKFADGRFTSRLDRHILHAADDSAGGLDMFRQYFSQLRYAGIGAISGFTVIHGPYGGLHNIGGCLKIQITDMKGVDFFPRWQQRQRLRLKRQKRFQFLIG